MTSQEKTAFRRKKVWKQFRKLFVDREGGCCELCGTRYNGKRKKSLQLHHKNVREYTNLNNMKDFVLLCSNCHKLVERLSIKFKNGSIKNYSKWKNLLYTVVSYDVKKILDRGKSNKKV